MNRILYVCVFCGHEGTYLYRHGKEYCCVRCDAPLDSVHADPDWAPEKTVFFQKPDGTYMLPANRDARMPPECIRVEAQSTHDKRRIVASMDREEREKAERVLVGRQMLREQTEAANRSELRDRMRHMTPAQRDFARFAMEKNNQKPKPRYTGAFYLQALEFDATNREPYRGRDGLGRREK